MIVFAPTALLATSRASSSRPATTRPGRPLSNHLVAACRARGCLPPSTRALHNAPTRRARRGPGRAGAAAARRAVLLFPRGRRASLPGWRGVERRLVLWRELFLWLLCAARLILEQLVAVARCRGDYKTRATRALTVRPCSRVEKCDALRLSPGLDRLPRCATRVRLRASRRTIRRERRMRDGSLSCGIAAS